MQTKKLQLLAEVFEDTISKFCYAIYLGGSRVDPVIENPHDYDYICFPKPHCKHFLHKELKKLGFKTRGSLNTLLKLKNCNTDLEYDFSQSRISPYETID